MAQWGSYNQPAFTFYMLPTRIFELLIGCFTSAVYGRIKHTPCRFSGIYCFVGLGLIAYSMAEFNKYTPWPSLYSLIPVIGTALLLLFCESNNLVSKLLRSNLLVKIGLISYSTYLWHQPIFAFSKIKYGNELGNLSLLFLCLCPFFIGFLSWRFIEQPFRMLTNLKSKYFVLLTLFLSILLISVGIIGFKNKGFESRFEEQQKLILRFDKYDYTEAFRRYSCFMEPENTFRDFQNICFGHKTTKAYLLWGDSYAAASSSGLMSIHSDIIQLTASTCPPFITSIHLSPNCRQINKFVAEKIAELRPYKIFLQANWIYYSSQNVIENISKTIDYIKLKSPNSEIVIIGSVPQWEPSLPGILARNNISLNSGHDYYMKMPSYEYLNSIDKDFVRLSKDKGFKFISLLDYLCLDEKCLAVTEYKNELWLTSFDSGHFTVAGSVYVFSKIFD